MLGIDIAIAVAWQRASAGDWASYAADVSRHTLYLTISQPPRPRHRHHHEPRKERRHD
jgi:hypothetical protein